MRAIKYTSRFKRDYKREKNGRHWVTLDSESLEMVRLGSHSELGL